MGSLLAALLVLSTSPQGGDERPVLPVPPTTALIATGPLIDGRLPFAALGLGRGGVVSDPQRRDATSADGDAAPGRWRSPGGVLVRAQPQGVKLDFAGGVELLVSPTARLHLRGGEQTESFRNGIELRLADGTRIRVVPDERRPTPLFVEVDVHGENGVTLFQGGGQVHRATPAPRTFRGLVAFVGGDGDAVFTATQLGPVIVLERILVAATASERSPPARAVVLGAPLAASLRQLPRNAPKRSVEYPQIHEVALRLAEAADSFFAPGLTLRPPAAIGDLLIPLVGDWYLDLDVHAHGMVTLGLTKSGAPAPAVEWLVGTRTELRFVRPDAGTGKGPRYYLRGIVVPEASVDVLDLVGRQRDVERARKTLFAIGADPRATDASTRRR